MVETAASGCAYPSMSACFSCRPIQPELQPAEHLWPLTNTVLVNRHFASIEDLEDAHAARCVTLQSGRDLVRSTTLLHWWAQRLKKRQGLMGLRRT